MATINATLTIGSGDLLTSNLAFSVASTLTKAGSANGLTKTTGLARTNFLSTDPASRSKILYRADDAATNGSNKVYLKNLSTTVAEFFTVYVDQEEMGRLYAGDFAFFPWSATQGTLETFVVTSAGTVAAGDSWNFDGITTTSADADSTNFAIAVDDLIEFINEVKQEDVESKYIQKKKKGNTWIQKKSDTKKNSGISKKYPNAKEADLNKNGITDAWLLDENNDGINEKVLMDFNEDGIIEGVALDENENNNYEMIVFDDDLDGNPDRIEYDEDDDGTMDVVGYDYNQDGEWDKFEELS